MKLILATILAASLAGCGDGSMPFEPCSSAKTVTVALIGDETMVGLTLADGAYQVAQHNPAAQLQDDLNAEFGQGVVTVRSYAVSGSTAAQAPTVYDADIIVANYGINDMKSHEPLSTFTTALRGVGVTLIETQNPVVDGDQLDQAKYVYAERSLGLPVADTFAYVSSRMSQLSDGTTPTDALYKDIVDNVLAPAVAKQVSQKLCRAAP